MVLHKDEIGLAGCKIATAGNDEREIENGFGPANQRVFKSGGAFLLARQDGELAVESWHLKKC